MYIISECFVTKTVFCKLISVPSHNMSFIHALLCVLSMNEYFCTLPLITSAPKNLVVKKLVDEVIVDLGRSDPPSGYSP